MPSGSSNWTWPEIEPLAALLASAESEPILCGGQAVGFWAGQFGLGGVVSRDLDIAGERADAERLAAQLGAAIHYPHRYDMTVLSALGFAGI